MDGPAPATTDTGPSNPDSPVPNEEIKVTSPEMVPASTTDEAQPIADLAAKVAVDIFELACADMPALGGLVQTYEDEWSKEDHANQRSTLILRGPDGRYYHGTITVTLTEQTVRTPVDDDATPAGAA